MAARLDNCVDKVEEYNFTDEEMGTFLAKCLNLKILSRDMFDAFWTELDEVNKDELIDRIEDEM